MQTRTIPADQWINFFDQFSRDHVGWNVSIQVLDDSAGPEHIAENLPLQGISFDIRGTRPGAIQISAGGSDDHVNHVIDLPLHIHQADEPNGDIDVRIEPARGPATLIHLRNPVL